MGAPHANSRSDCDFNKLAPLIRQQWPVIDQDALDATGGDYDRLVALIADKTEHTKVLVKRQLGELQAEADRAPPGSGVVDERLLDMLHKLHERSNEIVGFVKTQMATDAKRKVTENPLVSLLMAIGLGIFLGFILRGMGRRGGQ